MSDITSTNPGLVSVADEAYDGLPINVPSFEQVPASASPNNVAAANAVAGTGVATTSPAGTGPAQTAGTNVDGSVSQVDALSVDQSVVVSTPGPSLVTVESGNFKPGNATLSDVTANNVAGQVYGLGTPTNVYV